MIIYKLIYYIKVGNIIQYFIYIFCFYSKHVAISECVTELYQWHWQNVLYCSNQGFAEIFAITSPSNENVGFIFDNKGTSNKHWNNTVVVVFSCFYRGGH